MRSKHVLWTQGFREKDLERMETVLENMNTHKAQVGMDNREDEKARRHRDMEERRRRESLRPTD